MTMDHEWFLWMMLDSSVSTSNHQHILWKGQTNVPPKVQRMEAENGISVGFTIIFQVKSLFLQL